MCLAKLYLPGAEQPVMENIARLTFERGSLIAESLFGEKQTFHEGIQTISFTESKVRLIKAAEGPP